MTAKHTPGPWVVRQARTMLHISGETEGVCSLSISPPRVPEKDIRDRYVEAARANAALIAQAPRMLEVLEALLPMCEAIGPPTATGAGNVFWYSPDGDDSKDVHKGHLAEIIDIVRAARGET